MSSSLFSGYSEYTVHQNLGEYKLLEWTPDICL